jgi:hypothetical protein
MAICKQFVAYVFIGKSVTHLPAVGWAGATPPMVQPTSNGRSMKRTAHNGCRIGVILSPCTAQPVAAAWQTQGIARQTVCLPGGVELSTSSSARLRITRVDADTVRVRVAASGTFERDFAYAIAAAVPAAKAHVDERTTHEERISP